MVVYFEHRTAEAQTYICLIYCIVGLDLFARYIFSGLPLLGATEV